MIRLVVGDLVAHARIWVGILIVTVTTGAIGAVSAGLVETGTTTAVMSSTTWPARAHF